MERSIRIGKDFNVRWSIHRVVDGERQPYELAGKELVLQYRTPYGLKEATEWKVVGNTIVWTFRGKEQKALGSYELILTENGGKDGMVTVDTCRAFNLVAHSCEETEGSGSDIVIEDVVLESEVAFAPIVIEGGGGGSYDDTEIKEDIADLQAKDAEQAVKLTQLSEEVGELSERIEDINIESVGIYLPDTIHAVVGDTLQIFFRSVVDCAGIDAYDISAVSSKGKSYPRYWEYKATEAGSFALTLNVRSSASKIVATRQVTIRVVDATTSPSATQRILCIGASATQGGQWVGELNRRLTATSGNGTPANPTGLGLSNIEFVGRKVGTSTAVNLEATGGWRVQDYAGKGERAIRFQVADVDTLSVGAIYKLGSNLFIIQEVNVTEGQGNIRCTLQSSYTAPSASGVMTKSSGAGDSSITYSSYTEETFSPFWNEDTNKLDFKQYADKFCGGSIDVMIWHCGVNDIYAGTPESIDAAIAAFRIILAQYNEDFPNGKVIISSVPVGSLNGGFAANYGASSNGNAMVFMHQAQVYAKKLQDLCDEYTFATYAPVLEEFDAENGYPTKMTPVNNRVSETEVVGTNAVHPTTEGSYLVADAIYRAFNTLVLHSPVLADKWQPGSSTDYNPYVSAASFVTEYARGLQITLKKYSTGAIIRAFDSNGVAWGVVDYNIFDGRNNGDVIPLVITQSGSMNVPVGTVVGHIVFSDIAGFKSLPNDTGNGQEFIWIDPDDGKMVSSAENIYIAKGLGLMNTTSPRGVISFRVTNGNTYELYIPKTGNAYALHYAFGKSSTKGAIEAGIFLTEGVGEGNEQPATHTITADANPYLYVCYTLDGGVPTLKKL